MINVFERRKRVDDLAVGFVLFELCACDGDGNRVDAQARVEVRGVRFDVVDAQTEAANGGDEVLQIALVFQLKVDFEVVRAVMQGAFKHGEERERAEHGEEEHQRGGIKTRACGDAEQGAGEKTCRGGEPFDLRA